MGDILCVCVLFVGRLLALCVDLLSACFMCGPKKQVAERGTMISLNAPLNALYT